MSLACRFFGHRPLTVYMPAPVTLCRRCWKGLS